MENFEKARNHFLEIANGLRPKNDYLLRHLPQVEKWAIKILAQQLDANKDVVLSGVWLHDIGRMVGSQEIDHSINSEEETKRFFSELEVDQDFINQVVHCVRSHRCKDVEPKTIEAKVVAVADSASHMTDTVYIDMANKKDLDNAKQKLERDYRDVGLFSEIKKEITPLYLSWKKLLDVWPNS